MVYSVYHCPCTILSDASGASLLGIASHDPAVGHALDLEGYINIILHLRYL